jgi:hypothetical protein
MSIDDWMVQEGRVTYVMANFREADRTLKRFNIWWPIINVIAVHLGRNSNEMATLLAQFAKDNFPGLSIVCISFEKARRACTRGSKIFQTID